jgi:hypothetical protein
MWKMTLKQRRRQSELMAELERMKRNPYTRPPKGYVVGEKPEEDDKYTKAFAAVNEIIEELNNLEIDARARD